MTKTPRTRAQWQEAVTWAHFLLTLDAARQYGLVTGGPAVNVDRCAELLERGRRRGIEPQQDEDTVLALVTELQRHGAS